MQARDDCRVGRVHEVYQRRLRHLLPAVEMFDGEIIEVCLRGLTVYCRTAALLRPSSPTLSSASSPTLALSSATGWRTLRWSTDRAAGRRRADRTQTISACIGFPRTQSSCPIHVTELAALSACAPAEFTHIASISQLTMQLTPHLPSQAGGGNHGCCTSQGRQGCLG